MCCDFFYFHFDYDTSSTENWSKLALIDYPYLEWILILMNAMPFTV